MKALMEASREQSAMRNPQVKELPKAEPRPDLDAVAKEGIAA